MSGPVQLAPIAMLVLALALATGGCRGEDEVIRTKREFPLAGEELDKLQAATQGHDERCKSACMLLAAGDGTYAESPPIPFDRIDSCMVTGGKRTLEAWDDAQPSILLECTFEDSEPGAWTGWRPF